MRSIELVVRSKAVKAASIAVGDQTGPAIYATVASDGALWPWFLIPPTLVFVAVSLIAFPVSFVGSKLLVSHHWSGPELSSVGFFIVSLPVLAFSSAYVRKHFRSVIFYQDAVVLGPTIGLQHIGSGEFMRFPFDETTLVSFSRNNRRIRLGSSTYLALGACNVRYGPILN